MSIQSTQSNYNVDSNTKYLNYMKILLKALNYNKLQNITLNASLQYGLDSKQVWGGLYSEVRVEKVWTCVYGGVSLYSEDQVAPVLTCLG